MFRVVGGMTGGRKRRKREIEMKWRHGESRVCGGCAAALKERRRRHNQETRRDRKGEMTG